MDGVHMNAHLRWGGGGLLPLKAAHAGTRVRREWTGGLHRFPSADQMFPREQYYGPPSEATPRGEDPS